MLLKWYANWLEQCSSIQDLRKHLQHEWKWVQRTRTVEHWIKVSVRLMAANQTLIGMKRQTKKEWDGLKCYVFSLDRTASETARKLKLHNHNMFNVCKVLWVMEGGVAFTPVEF